MSSSPINSLISDLSELEDFRVESRITYPLVEILFQSLCGVLSGASTWNEIETFGSEKLDWLVHYLPYKEGFVKTDTLRRVFSYLNSRHLEEILFVWLTRDVVLPNGSHISFDGKRLRGSATKKEQQTKLSDGGKQMLNMVQAWSSEVNMCLGTAHSVNNDEQTALSELLDLVNISDSIVSIDAIGCNPKVVNQIVGHGADYLLGVKHNQQTLFQAVDDLFLEVQASPIDQPHPELVSTTEDSRGHGRIESRTIHVLPAQMLDKSLQRRWKNIQSVIAVESTRKVQSTQKESHAKRYYISSLDKSPSELLSLIRGHWNIENQLHWSLDVQFGEDRSQKRNKIEAKNYGILLRVALSLLKKNTDKVSMTRRKLKCALSDEYRHNTLFK